MFTRTEAVAVFPTMIWQHQVEPEIVARINPAMGAKIDELYSKRPPIVPKQGWQTDQNLHLLPDFQELVTMINHAGKGVLDSLEAEYEAFEITSCWANINPPGKRHIPHHHPNNFLSGVYYLRTPKGAPPITFFDPRPQAHFISPKVRKNNAYNSGQVNVEACEGLLVLFPAWLIHQVGENRTNENRISISFNLMFSSFTEKHSPVKWTGSLVRED